MKSGTLKHQSGALMSIDEGGKSLIISDDPAGPACHSAAADQVRQKVSDGSGLQGSI